MGWKEEIKQKQDLVDATVREIEEIKRKNTNALLEPLKEKYLNKIIKIDSETYMYVTKIDDERHIRGISIGSYACELDFFIEYDTTEMINDGYGIASKDELVEFINNKLTKTLNEIQ